MVTGLLGNCWPGGWGRFIITYYSITSYGRISEGSFPVREAVRKVRRATAPCADRYLEVRHEDLVADPPAVLERIAAHCRFVFVRRFTRYLPDRLPDMNQKRRERLSDTDISAMHSAIGPFLRELGYATTQSDGHEMPGGT